jgi:hypothetical protein
VLLKGAKSLRVSDGCQAPIPPAAGGRDFQFMANADCSPSIHIRLNDRS